MLFAISFFLPTFTFNLSDETDAIFDKMQVRIAALGELISLLLAQVKILVIFYLSYLRINVT